MSASSLRARVRSEMSHEIKEVARQHLAAEGASLSLRGVARDMGIVPSALYRYFPSRDALLTALILDGYEALARVTTEAEAGVPREDLRGRWHAVCSAARKWALEHPAEYGLLYGNPVPGYLAPQDTVEPATKVVLLLVGVLADAGDSLAPLPSPVPGPVRADLRKLLGERPGAAAEEQLDRVFAAWTQLFGLLSFEVFGRMNDLISARTEYFDHHVGLMADLAGLPRRRCS
ncbi:TetR/AcrR family transcriptional regulator [Amycolatopsis magusensis]|uniref:TetR/AcrR family transcriptional regulator n=1 Tax=Amycolatopsis magusensis TaxID=882444 RepID=UPI003C2C908E